MTSQQLLNFDESGAIFSDDRRCRFSLFRVWDETKLNIMFIGLNPSTANEIVNDPTIRRVISFASSWGYDLYPLSLGNKI